MADKQDSKGSQVRSTQMVPERAKAPEGFVHVSAEYPSYSHETCEGMPLQGRLLDHVDMPDAKDDLGQPKEWSALLFQVTKEVLVTSRDGVVEMAKIGDKVTVGISKALEEVAKLATNPAYIFEVWMLAGAKRKITGTAKTFVPWEIHVNPKPIPRPPSAFSIRNNSHAPAQLAMGLGTSSYNPNGAQVAEPAPVAAARA